MAIEERDASAMDTRPAPPPLTGGCLCGAVRYEITAEPVVSCHCHCSLCRRASGAPFATWTTVPLDGFRWTRGTPARFRSSEKAARDFCSACGTQLTFRLEAQADGGKATLDVTSASLDAPERIAPTAHIWLSSRVAWDVVPDDGLERFEEGFPPGRYG